jgi:hypothetical protein
MIASLKKACQKNELRTLITPAPFRERALRFSLPFPLFFASAARQAFSNAYLLRARSVN